MAVWQRTRLLRDIIVGVILAVDLGQKTTGLAISHGQLATPYSTITYSSLNLALTKIVDIIELENIDTVILGFVEGKIKPMFERFAQKLKKAKPNLKVILWDETLTSRQATESMVKLGIAKTRRAERRHEVAAALILQSYLDSR